MNILQGGLQC